MSGSYFFIKSYIFLVRMKGYMHWGVVSRVNNGHGGVSVACPTTDIIFLFHGNARHSNVCYYMAMAQKTSDLPSWPGGSSWAAHASSPLMALDDLHKHGGRN